MLALNDVHRSEPIYLCGTHAAKIGRATVATTSETESPESAPARIRSQGTAANSNSALHATHGRRYLYILLLVAGLALVGVFFGPRLFRRVPPQSKKPAAIVKPQEQTAGSTLPQKAPPKAEPAMPQKQPQQVPKQAVPKQAVPKQAVPKANPQLPKPSLQTAHVAAKGTVAQKVLPDVPKEASNTIRGTILVSVQVQVDASGNVAQTKLVFRGPSRYFARLAVESAQRWKFNPPVVAGESSPSEWLIRFYFTRKATTADAIQATSAATPPK